MITYKAIFKFLDGGVHAEVLDFPSVISQGGNLDDARQMLAGALVDMAETALLLGEALPPPNASASDPEAELEELIHLVVKASSRVEVVPVAA